MIQSNYLLSDFDNLYPIIYKNKQMHIIKHNNIIGSIRHSSDDFV
jgi:hypothetical protein